MKVSTQHHEIIGTSREHGLCPLQHSLPSPPSLPSNVYCVSSRARVPGDDTASSESQRKPTSIPNQHTIILPDTNARHSTLASRAKWSHLREGCCPVHQHQYRLQTCHHGPHTHHTWFAPSSPPLLLPFSSHPLSPSPYLSAHGATSAGSRRLLHSVSFYPAPLALANPPFPAAVKHFSVT